MEPLIIIVLALLTIAAATLLGPRFGVASPLVLLVVGVVVGFLPFVPAIEVEPEWILAGVLPPLLYSASVSMPAMDFRRDFGAIGGLSVVLVIITSLVLGVVFAWLIPGLGLAWGIALGAIVSPTDAVATTIVKRLGVAPRAVAILEGESLLNDATALVLLRSAIAGAAASISLWEVAGDFVFAVVVAGLIGLVIGHLNIWLRARVKDATVNTVLSFTVPFLASIPSELLGASGLVAAVVAGIITGRHAPERLSPQHRLSDAQNWRTIELVLEGAVFLLMGLQVYGIVVAVEEAHAGALSAAGIAAIALVLVIVVRTLYVAPLLIWLKKWANRGAKVKPRITMMQERIADPEVANAFDVRDDVRSERRGRRPRRAVRTPSASQLERFSTRLRRSLADIDYLMAAPLGWREGTLVVWAGMRGAVTLAAAQTLPADTPERPMLIFIAFLVAAASLIIQGGTITWLIRAIKPAAPDPAAADDDRERIRALLVDAAAGRERPRNKEELLAMISRQRAALLAARDDGIFSSEALESALLNLDADQIALELRISPFAKPVERHEPPTAPIDAD